MIDIHCHILPELDDGPKDMDRSVAMCEVALADGIETIVGTPHVREGFFSSTPEAIEEKVADLRDALDSRGIQVNIAPGADVRVAPEMLTDPESMTPFTINNNGKYLLLEFADELLPPGPERLVSSLTKVGITPIITHPERNFVLTRDPKILWQLVMEGALVQVTASALTGRGGPPTERYIRQLLEHRMVHFLATDGHNLDTRPVILSEGYGVASSIVGDVEASRLVADNPAAVLEGEPIDRMLPQPFEPRMGRPPRLSGGGWLSRLLGR